MKKMGIEPLGNVGCLYICLCTVKLGPGKTKDKNLGQARQGCRNYLNKPHMKPKMKKTVGLRQLLTALCLSLGIGSAFGQTTLTESERNERLAQQIRAEKREDVALLLVAFGSTWDEPLATFEQVKARFAKEFPQMDVYLAFTSSICIKRCEQKGKGYFYSPKTWLKVLCDEGYDDFVLQPLHVTPGKEYEEVDKAAAEFVDGGPRYLEDPKVYLSEPLLNRDEDIDSIAACLYAATREQVEAGKVVAFMGHGTPDVSAQAASNQRYTLLEAALQKLNPRYFVATVDMEGNLIADLLERMKTQGLERKGQEVVCLPLMVVAGDHANNDMRGGDDPNHPDEESWRAAFVKAGYHCPLENCILKGLAAYPEVVERWIAKLKRILSGRPTYETMSLIEPC